MPAALIEYFEWLDGVEEPADAVMDDVQVFSPASVRCRLGRRGGLGSDKPVEVEGPEDAELLPARTSA